MSPAYVYVMTNPLRHLPARLPSWVLHQGAILFNQIDLDKLDDLDKISFRPQQEVISNPSSLGGRLLQRVT